MISLRIRCTIFLLAAAILWTLTPALHAQSMQQGLTYYHQKKFDHASAIFSQIKDSQGSLFAAKSNYALGRYRLAQSNLNNIASDAPPLLLNEAAYTSALIQYQQKNFADALTHLNKIYKDNTAKELHSDAQKLYRQILGYLSARQRIEALKTVSSDPIKFDLLNSGMGKMPYAQAKQLYRSFRHTVNQRKWKDRGKKFEATIKDPAAYRNKYGSTPKKLIPPRGTVYTIGLMMPKYTQNDRGYGTVKALYFGALLAAKNYNQRHQRTKVKLAFVNSGSQSAKLKPVIENFINRKQGDILIGPLFSQKAEQIIPLLTNFHLPTIAPLANADIHAENSFLFQANPSYKMHGKTMAKYAVENMGFQTFAVIAGKGTGGEESANAFSEQIKKSGADIKHYTIENLQANNYPLLQYVREIKSSQQPIDAIYAPFTGPQAHKIIDLLLDDLDSMNLHPAILGSQKYELLNFNSGKYRNFKMYFTEGIYQNDNDRQLQQFKASYKNTFHSAGNQYAIVGYDVSRFILQTLNKVGNPDVLKSALSNSSGYRGIIQNYNFKGGNVNQAVQILKVGPSGNITEQN